MLPSWIPGSYLLREFARHVVAIEAHDDSGPVAITQTAKGSWTVSQAEGAVVVRMVVHAFDLSVRGAWFARDRAFFNGTSLFLLPEGQEQTPVELSVQAPGSGHGFRATTAMTPAEVDAQGFGRYVATNYDELIDHPFEIGSHEIVEFEAAGVPHRFALTGRADTDLERVATDLTQLCTTQIEFFGKPAPFERYTFLGLATGDGYGGLEHRASSSLIFRRTDLPKPGETGIPRNYQRFLGLCSHEYFHSWHIKQSKPAAFMPYQLDRRNPTRLLWVFEGITSYFQERFLLYSGLLGKDAYLRRLAEALTRVYRVPGRHRQSLEQSSINAWDRLYKPHPNSINQDVSYYGKGAMLALALDLKLRAESGHTLDAIVKAIWQRFGSQGKGLPEDGFEALAEEFGGSEIRRFVTDAVCSTADPDLPALFQFFGLALRFRQAEGPRDTGGTPASDQQTRLSLGAAFEPAPQGLKLSIVPEGQAAESAGLAPGDIIVAVDRTRVSSDGLAEQLARFDSGDQVVVSFFRDDQLRETALQLKAAPEDTCFIEPDDQANDQAIALRNGWLGQE